MSEKLTPLGSILHLRCPRCRTGKVYAGLLRMYSKCPHCGLTFEREAGYFIGSMYISYAMATVILGLGMFLFYTLFPSLPDVAIFGFGCLVLLPFVPLIIRYSRVIWMSVDRALDK